MGVRPTRALRESPGGSLIGPGTLIQPVPASPGFLPHGCLTAMKGQPLRPGPHARIAGILSEILSCSSCCILLAAETISVTP